MAKKIKGLVLHGDRMVVYQDIVEAKEKRTKSGITYQLATQATTKASSGIVVNVGSNLSDVKTGDRVVFSPYSGFAMHYKGDARYILLGSHEVFAHYEGEVGDVEIR